MRVLVAVLASFAVLCAPAGASTVSYAAGYIEPPGTPPEESCSRYMQCPPGVVTFQGGAGETNAVSVSTSSAGIVFRDAGAPLTAGTGCTRQEDGSVTCPGGTVNILLGDAADSVASTFTLQLVRGEDGDDVLSGAARIEGGGGNDRLTGGPSPDRLLPGAGSDVVEGGGGDDVLLDDGGVEADRFDGGEGNDELNFSGRDTAVRADLGARPVQAGSAGEGNAVANVERIAGGAGADELFTDPSAPVNPSVVLSGAEGDDRLTIRGAATQVDGGPGADTVVGGPGRDSIAGGIGDDTLSGGPGNDLLDGDAGRDRIRGGSGRDTILGGDNADRVVGGSGNDRVSGGSGGDDLRGESGSDFLNGGGGNDVLRGGSSGDEIIGGSGRDRVLAGPGPDRVAVADGNRDRVSCGGSRDRVTLDRRDTATGCERRRGR